MSYRYGNAIAMALENSPADARGLMSGILQQGYSFGYVCAACANLGVGGAVDTWKTIFWIAAGLSIGVGLIRMAFPESQQFIEARKAGHKSGGASHFWKETKVMLGQEWKMCIYCIILMTWFNCKFARHKKWSQNTWANHLPTDYSHTSQDSYTTFMITEKGLNNAGASRASILMKAGACVRTNSYFSSSHTKQAYPSGAQLGLWAVSHRTALSIGQLINEDYRLVVQFLATSRSGSDGEGQLCAPH